MRTIWESAAFRQTEEMLLETPWRGNHHLNRSFRRQQINGEPAGDDVALHFGSSGVDRASLGIVVKRLLKSLGDEHIAFDNAMRYFNFCRSAGFFFNSL
jgi:hypothetical protein